MNSFEQVVKMSFYENGLTWDKPMTSRQAAKYLMTNHFVPVEWLRSTIHTLTAAHNADTEEKDKAIAELVGFVGCVANSLMVHPDYGDEGGEFTDLVDTADELIAKYGRE